MKPDARYERNPSVVSRQIAGETILVPIRGNAADLESIYMLNETAASAWSLMDGRHTLEQIRDAILAEYAVGGEDAERDLIELVTQLEALGALVRC
jgi:hypothetical protein